MELTCALSLSTTTLRRRVRAAAAISTTQNQRVGEEWPPLGTLDTENLPWELSLEDGLASLKSFVGKLSQPPFESGILRLQVPLPPSIKAVHWLRGQTLVPQVYMSTRGAREGEEEQPTEVAGVGSTVLFRGTEPFSRVHWKSIKRYLSEDSPLVRAYGAMRFDPYATMSEEWEAFGTFYFFIPRIELCELRGCSILAVNLAWGDVAFPEAVEALLNSLERVAAAAQVSSLRQIRVDRLLKQHIPDERSWHHLVEKTLELLDDHDSGLQKVVMARRTELQIAGDVHPLSLLSSIEEQSPSAYRFLLRLPDGSTFFGNTPEQLFSASGVSVTSEAIAATRPRGVTNSDDYHIGLSLLESSKDHVEFQIVEDHVTNALKSVCKHVEMATQKSILKQPGIQHLCTRFTGKLRPGSEEYDMLSALHPTPAVCGYPSTLARHAIVNSEAFDRGMYAGPVGWFGGQGTEFAVGIRSSLIIPDEQKGTRMYLYAGVGIVKESKPEREWLELDLKISQFEMLLQQKKDLDQHPNVNILWANILVEECCRLGVTHFCIGPGSRSSPLAEAAAANPRISCVSCLDERSLAYYALGYGRGSRSPAAIVVTSGTAVSNLLPAIVEASQDCVPMLVLTADRPHELRDSGANQTINQVDHFGKFVRYHFDLPAATDELAVKMILTTLDSAVFHATRSPCGPVHINCPFREPLEAVTQTWHRKCLQGLCDWTVKTSPFTSYISATTMTDVNSQMQAVTDLLSGAERGMIVVGGINQEQDVWSICALARHLKWPLVPDVLSGLRLARGRCSDVKMILNFDHVLLHPTPAPDVILQVGGRITSKRIAHFLSSSAPRAHILVEDHPYRHDPAHTLTHRIDSSATEFTRVVLKKELKCNAECGSYATLLHLLSETVRRELQFHLHSEASLTEPWIAQVVSSSVKSGNALFLGNSMPIRDVDMYASSSPPYHDFPLVIQCAANRGASGIDGVLSTAVGFSTGSKKQVTLLLGDVSFLHDTNGLMILAGREGKAPPLTVVVVNNGGGGIFSLLPIARYMPHVPFTRLLTTAHDVNIQKLCQAHGLNHLFVETKAELARALELSLSFQASCLVEAGSNIEKNASFHRYLQTEVCSHLESVFSKLPSQADAARVIREVDVFSYKIRLKAPVTTGHQKLIREGFVLLITLSQGYIGTGEIAPLQGLHLESLADVKEQLIWLASKLKGSHIPSTVELLDGSFSEWLWSHLGVEAEVIFPSVRCGLEMAVLQSVAASKACTLWQLLERSSLNKEAPIHVCGLVDSCECPDEVACAAEKLVMEGFSSLKIKVARLASPMQDARVVLAVRQKVGRHVSLRVDANGRWTLPQALEFSNAVQGCGLEYLEEPVQASDLAEFLKQTRVPIAIDESVDAHATTFAQFLDSLPNSKLVAAVIKPSRVGGFEKAYKLARLSLKRKMSAVISSCFESSISLVAYAQFAAFVDPRQAHGLGTCKWLEDDIVDIGFSQYLKHGIVDTASTTSMGPLRNSCLEKMEFPRRNSFTVDIKRGSYVYTFRVIESVAQLGEEGILQTVVFLHGLLGRAEEWVPVMDSLARSSFRCFSVELPGHGRSSVTQAARPGGVDGELSMESLGMALSELLPTLSESKVVLVGYSLGARVAIYMASRACEHLEAAVSISGSPGLKDVQSRRDRATKDSELAGALRLGGLSRFVSSWYRKSLWKSLRSHPDFDAIRKTRVEHEDVSGLADAMERLSVGRQECLWQHLGQLQVPLLVVTGSLDSKFVKIGRDMVTAGGGKVHLLAEVDASGHAVHLECPLSLIRGLRTALNHLRSAAE